MLIPQQHRHTQQLYTLITCSTYSKRMQELTALSQEFFRASSAVIRLDGSKMSILSSKHRAPDGRLHSTQSTFNHCETSNNQSTINHSITWLMYPYACIQLLFNQPIFLELLLVKPVFKVNFWEFFRQYFYKPDALCCPTNSKTTKFIWLINRLI